MLHLRIVKQWGMLGGVLMDAQKCLQIGNVGSKALKGTEDIWGKDHSTRRGPRTFGPAIGVCL